MNFLFLFFQFCSSVSSFLPKFLVFTNTHRQSFGLLFEVDLGESYVCGWRFICTARGTILTLFQVLGCYFNFSSIQAFFDCTINRNCIFKVGFSFPYTILTFLVVEIVKFLVGVDFGDFWLSFVNWGFSVELWELWIFGQCWIVDRGTYL